MNTARAYSLHEAAVDYQPPQRLKMSRERARELPNDPSFLHSGYTVRLDVRGQATDLFGIGAVAGALGKSTGTVRRLITDGVLAEPPFRSPGRTWRGQKRLWTREQVLAIAIAALDAEVFSRQPRRWSDVNLSELVAAQLATA